MVVWNLCFRRGIHLKVHRQFDRLDRFGVVRKRVGKDPRVRVREVGPSTENMVAEPVARPELRDSYLACKTIISSQPAVLSKTLASKMAGSSVQQPKDSSREFDGS